MGVTAPEWLVRRGGGLRPHYDGQGWVVVFDEKPLYVVAPVPAGGKYTCKVMQTNNGRRLEKGSTYATADEAVRGGLEELRAALGW